MNTEAQLLFAQAHLGMLYAASSEDTHARIGIDIAQEGLQCVIHGYHPDHSRGYDTDRIALCAERLKNYTDSEQKHLNQPEGDHAILPGATYEGALVYQAYAVIPDMSFVELNVSNLLKELERFLLTTARLLDQRGKERVWRPHQGK